MTYRPHVSITKQRDAYAKTNGVCFICGKKMSSNENAWSVDHFIPRAVYKWVPNQQLHNLIESGDNIFVVHPKCNYNKDSALPTNKRIGAMHVEKTVKTEVKELYRIAEPSLVEYNAIKQSTWSSQDKKCALCGKQIPLNAATLRRKNNQIRRCRNNAICLCKTCNAQNAHYKRVIQCKL